ncbi:MAG: hypothetical protein IIZ38_21615 [Sphingomonas sp.]|uniref:hypothetical protein n=1 Tax=unclassified Sphingomonas TaxID=196159 RepID=UPI002457E0A0|nr:MULTISPECIES: hypothetical protein [unclassified Sphingomonas]MBQ1500917.1 hypothetical protein [Sphingomonas sp.]MDH4743672.1 hypothetical protein [Sphingomonas sp. CBMAI 2297]
MLKRHPRFDAAVSNLTDGLATLYGGDRRLIRELSEYKRAVTFMLAICIAAGEREEDPETWLTVARLVELAKIMAIGPARRVRRYVEEMRADGHLIETPMAEDRRRHRLRPTEAMLAIDREWVAVFHAPLALMFPEEPRYRAAVSQDPAYHHYYRARSLITLAMARETMVEHPPVDSFLHQAGGARILATLLQSARDNPDGWTEPGFYSLAAERSATTRVHVRGILRTATAAGYVEIVESQGTRVRATAALVEDFRNWSADSLATTDLVSLLTQSL